MGKVILVITLTAIVSCYAAADKKRVRKSEQGQVLGLLLYYGTGVNETCDELIIKNEKIIPIGSEVRHLLYFDSNATLSTDEKSFSIVKERQITKYTITLTGENCTLKIANNFCYKNRYINELLPNCEKEFMMYGQEIKSCTVEDARITSIGIALELKNPNKISTSLLKCTVIIKNNS